MAQDPKLGREILPIPDVPTQPKPAMHAKDTAAPAIHPLRPIEWVQIDIGEDDVSHLEDPEQAYRRILSRQ